MNPELKKLVNLGCGTRLHKDWVNIDFVALEKGVIQANLVKGVPLPDGSADVVYHSHVLEHFTKRGAEIFTKECYRVLKPGGIIRIAVPNLEPIIQNYIANLPRALEGDKSAEANYDWTMLELYDQCVRDTGGGEMKNYFKQDVPNKDFVRSRIGHFFDLMSDAHQHRSPASTGWKQVLKKILPIDGLRKTIRTTAGEIPAIRYYSVGKFRAGGEIHQWMYDRFSLARLLRNSGFSQITQRSAAESYIKNWASYNLDTEPDGTVYKADSLFMEAIK